MNYTDIIRNRRSVRTLKNEALSEKDRELIINYANGITNPYGVAISWQLLSAKEDRLSVPVISGGDTYITGKLKKQEHAEEAFGFAFEQLVLYAESIGVSTTWIAGTMDRKAFERAIDLKEDEVMPCVSPLGYKADKMSFRETMMRKGVKADERLPFEALFFDRDFSQPLDQQKAGELLTALENVRCAPSAVNRQPWRLVLDGNKVHFYEYQSRGYQEGAWDIQKIDLGIALCHFDCSLKELGKNAKLKLEDPELETPDNTCYIATYEF